VSLLLIDAVPYAGCADSGRPPLCPSPIRYSLARHSLRSGR